MSEVLTASVNIIMGKFYLMIRFDGGTKVELNDTTENSIMHELEKHHAQSCVTLGWETPVPDEAGCYTDHWLSREGGKTVHEYTESTPEGGCEYRHVPVTGDKIMAGCEEMLELYHALRGV